MAELADALDLGSSGVTPVQVQVLFPAPPLAKCRRSALVTYAGEVIEAGTTLNGMRRVAPS